MFENIIETYGPLVRSVREFFPEAVLVGGALRDTYYGVEVKDLDFVIPRGPNELRPIHPINGELRIGNVAAQEFMDLFPEQRGWKYVDLPDDNEYEGIIGEGPLLDVVESTDKKVNLILVTSVPEYTSQFPDSISQMVFDGTDVHVSRWWTDGNENGLVYYKPDIKANRLAKLKAKYTAQNGWLYETFPQVGAAPINAVWRFNVEDQWEPNPEFQVIGVNIQQPAAPQERAPQRQIERAFINAVRQERW